MSVRGGVDLDGLFRNLSPLVHARGRVLLGSHHDADDLVQDVFVRVVRSIRGLEDPDVVRPWVMTIAGREAFRKLCAAPRALRNRAALHSALPCLVASPVTPEQALEAGRALQRLRQLPADQSESWLLRYVHQETLALVATKTGRPLSTTKRRIAAARRALKRAVA